MINIEEKIPVRNVLSNISMLGEMLERGKNSIVIPIHKRGEKQRMENCRGISLINACCKLYGKY
jgi:hypothetical protein